MIIHVLGLLVVKLSLPRQSWAFVATPRQHGRPTTIAAASVAFSLSDVQDVSATCGSSAASSLQIVDDTVDGLLQEFIVMEDASYPNLQERTDPYLDYNIYPLGSLVGTLSTGALMVMNAWARTASPTGALTAAAILNRLEQEQENRIHNMPSNSNTSDNTDIDLSVMHYSVVAHAWAKSNHHQAGVQAEQVLNSLLERSKTIPLLTPNRVVYNCVIHAWSRQGNTERAEAIFERMKTDPKVIIETADYNALLSAYARQGNARKAESVLKEMLDSHIEPDLISYNCILDSWKQDDEPGAAERAESILQTLQQNHDDGMSDIRPNGRSYSSVASAYIKTGRSDSIAQAERLLSLAEERGLAHDSYLHNAVLDAWAMSDHVDAAHKAEAILAEMEKVGNVNTVSYNTVIKAWRRSNYSDAATRAESLLIRMERLHAEDYTLAVGPDVFTYTSVIQCYTKNNSPGSASKAVGLLTRMIDACRAGNDNLKPNTITVNVVLDALAKTGEETSAIKAQEILNMFRVSCESCLDRVNLNTVSFTSVIDAYAKSGVPTAAQKAMEIFEAMEEEYANGNSEAKPNTRSYNTLMNAWIQTGSKGSVEQAEALLLRMEEEYQGGNVSVEPDVISFSIVMNGWSKSGTLKALEKTSDVFNRMVKAYKSGNKTARPNLHSFVTLLYAVVHSGRTGAPQQAENLLKGMYKDYQNGNTSAKPNTQAITLVIDCWAKSGDRNAGEKAEALLDWMIQLYDESNRTDESFRPNPVTWNAAVNAWAKSRVFGKAGRAKRVLDRMVQMYESDPDDAAKPNTFVYTAVVNAAAYTVGDRGEKQDAFRIASKAFTDLEESNYGKPNHVTFGAYVTACRNLIPQGESRALAVGKVFEKCCQVGMVNDMVLQRVQSALTTEELQSLFAKNSAASVSPMQYPLANNAVGSIADAQSLPLEWRRNVSDKMSANQSKRIVR